MYSVCMCGCEQKRRVDRAGLGDLLEKKENNDKKTNRKKSKKEERNQMIVGKEKWNLKLIIGKEKRKKI